MARFCDGDEDDEASFLSIPVVFVVVLGRECNFNFVSSLIFRALPVVVVTASINGGKCRIFARINRAEL